MPKETVEVESSKTVLQRTLKLAEESKQVGINTLVKLDEQTEQMRRVKADAEDTEQIIKGNRGVVKDMRRSWVVRLCCYNRADILPDDPNWSHRDKPEEQMRVKKMIKLDKRRRRLRRNKKKEAAAGGGDGSPKSEKKNSSWKFWNKRITSDDSSDLSDLSEEDDSEEEEPSPMRQAQRIVPKVSEKLIPDVGPIEIEDEESGLDQLRTTIQDMKVIALQISETSQQQTAALGSISEQVNRNQSHLDRNNELIGKMGQRAKADGDDGVLSAQDRLAIMGVKSALSARMN
jgi:hypothetical protein